MLPKAVIFDLDGTLIDSSPDVAAAVNKVMQDMGQEELPVAYVEGFIGLGPRLLLQSVFADCGLPDGQASLDASLALYMEHYRAEPTRHTELFPHVREDLAALRSAGMRLGICTNKPHDLTELVLGKLGMDSLFDAVLGAGTGVKSKPHPNHPRAVLDLLGCSPAETVYVGDTETDRECARAAGVPFCIVSWGGGTRMAAGDDTRIRRLADLLAFRCAAQA